MKKPSSSLRAGSARVSLRQLPWLTIPLLCVLVSAQALHAANGTWIGTQTGARTWVDPTNWISSIVPGSLGTTNNVDTATFSTATAPVTVGIDAGRNVARLLFNGTNSAGTYTIGNATANTGEVLHLSSISTGTSISMAAGTLGNVATITINAPLILEGATPTTAGAFNFSNNAFNDANGGLTTSPKLNFAGDISGGTTTGAITLSLGGSVGSRSASSAASALTLANTISGVISNGGASSLSLNLSGGSGASWYNAWNLTGVNTYTGSTVVGVAALYFNSIGNIGVPSALGAGSALELNSGSHVGYTGAGDASTNRTVKFAGGSLYNLTSGTTITLTGAVDNSGGMILRGTGTIAVTSVISGAGGLTKTGGGTASLSNVNTFTGSVSISAGTVVASNLANAGLPSSLGAGAGVAPGNAGVITFGQPQNGENIGRLQFTGAAGGSTNRPMVLSTGINSATLGSGATIENMVAGQTLTMSGTVRASDATTRTYLELGGAGNGVMSGIIAGTNAVPTASMNLAFIKSGTGTWELTQANVFQSVAVATTSTNATLFPAVPAKIQEGTLLANNATGSALGTASVLTTAGSGATIGGTGSITGGTSQSITLSTGTFLMVGNTHNVASGGTGANGYTGAVADFDLGSATNVALTLAGTLQFDLFGNDPLITPGEADLLKLYTTAGSITLGGVISLVDSSSTHAPWTEGVWQIIDWSGVGAATRNGAFTFNLPTASLASGYSFDTTNFLSTGQISVVSGVPEPGRAVLMLLGLALAVMRRRR